MMLKYVKLVLKAYHKQVSDNKQSTVNEAERFWSS